jgi:two-component sensor histidine kinase
VNISSARMTEPDDFRRLLDFVREPLFVVDPAGRVDTGNAAARALIGRPAEGFALADAGTGDPVTLLRFLRRAAGSRQAIPGALVLTGADGSTHRLQCRAAVLTPGGDGRAARILLHCHAQGPEEFAILRRSIAELNREVRLRQSAVVALEAAVRHRGAALAELHHRVKNTTQMLIGMVGAALREAEGSELRTFLTRMRARLAAIGAAQQFMYRLDRVDGVAADDFLPALADALATGWPAGTSLVASADPAELPNDMVVPLALIVDELATNALKHGLRNGPGTVQLTLGATDGMLRLSVTDDGGRWAVSDGAKGHSGLGLVRALCRQIGAVLEITGGQRTRAEVRIPLGGRAAA